MDLILSSLALFNSLECKDIVIQLQNLARSIGLVSYYQYNLRLMRKLIFWRKDGPENSQLFNFCLCLSVRTLSYKCEIH